MAQGAWVELPLKTRVGDRICDPRIFQPFQSELTAITEPTGSPVRTWIITTPSERVIEAQLEPFFYDFFLRQVNQGGVDFDAAFALHPGLSGEIRHSFEGADVFLTAVGITAVVELIGAKGDVLSFNPLRQRPCKGKKNRISRRHVSDRYAPRDFAVASTFGNCDLVSECVTP